MAKFSHKTPIGKLSLGVYQKGRVSCVLKDFKFEGQPFYYFYAEFHQLKNGWRVGTYINFTLDRWQEVDDDEMRKRLVKAVREHLAEWWIANDLRATRAVLLERKKWVESCVESSHRELSERQTELKGIKQELFEIQKLQRDMRSSDGVVGALLK